MNQLTTNQALTWYGLGGLTAFAGWFNQMFLIYGMAILFTISLFLTLGGD